MYKIPEVVALDLDSLPNDDPVSRWGGGVVVPLVLLGIGIHYLITRVVSFDIVTLTGIDAVIAALCFVFAAAYLHFHFYWSLTERLSPHAEGAKLLTALFLVLSFGYSVFATFRFAIVN